MKEEGRGQGGAAEWREKTRKAAEEEAAKTEADDGEEGFDPTVGLRCVMGGGTAKAKEDCVALMTFVRSCDRTERGGGEGLKGGSGREN